MARKPTPKVIQKLLASAGVEIAGRLPSSWTVSVASRTTDGGIVRFVTPAGDPFEVPAFVRRRLDPRAAAALPDFDGLAVVISDWLSPRTRTILDDRGQSYADTTGNLSISVDEPLVVIQADGATRDPAPRPKTLTVSAGHDRGHSNAHWPRCCRRTASVRSPRRSTWTLATSHDSSLGSARSC